jgi:putative membrane protein
MKQKSISFLHLAMVAVATSVLTAANVAAQTSVSDNPHLRAKDEPRKAAPPISDKDRKFIQDAANGGGAEVADGRVAMQRGESAEVKKIGSQMVADHSKANKELVALADKKGIAIEINKAKARNFPKENFDGNYLASMETDHKADIKVFEKEASSGNDAELKAWAAKTLPTLKMHLSMVQDAMKKRK